MTTPDADWTCPTGKQQYPSPQQAWHTAGKVLHRNRTAEKHRNKTVSAYRCDLCEAWHLTSKPKRPT